MPKYRDKFMIVWQIVVPSFAGVHENRASYCENTVEEQCKT